MKNRLLLILLALCACPSLWSAGSCTTTDVTSSQNAQSRIPDAETVIITIVCTADASTGSYPAVTVPLTGAYPSGSVQNAYNLTGYILYEVGRKPGTTAPTNNYTTVITDARGFALDLALLTTNGSSTVAQLTPITSATLMLNSYPVVRSALTVQLSANSVNSAGITLDLIFRTRP